MLNVSLRIKNYIRRIGLSKLNIWFPQKLKKNSLMVTNGPIFAISISKANATDLFLNWIIGDEKWLSTTELIDKDQELFTAINRIESWITSKQGYALYLVEFQSCLYILRCFQETKRSTQIFTANNLWNWRKQSKRKVHNWQKVKELCSTETKWGHF